TKGCLIANFATVPSAIYLVLTIFFVLACCVTALTWFMNDGYSRIAEMQRMEAVWQKKAPLADISTCDGKPCVKVDTRTTYGDKGSDAQWNENSR
ncbi:TPA: hypothetical protein IDY61_005321, partial [Escherichia coli]|nr:hypothetical protein [Escherichia coli]